MLDFLNEPNPFVVYQSVELPKLKKLSLPLGDIDLPDDLYIGNNGIVQAQNNIPEVENNNTQSQFIINNTEEYQPSVVNNISNENNFKSGKGIKGNKQRAKEFFMNKGLSEHAAAGIVGNLMQESGLNTTIPGDRGKAYGIAQWHPDRQKGLKLLAQKKGTDVSDFDTQLEYIWEELNNTHKGALNALLKSKNVDEATVAFMRHFEKPNEKYANLKQRIKFANSLLS